MSLIKNTLEYKPEGILPPASVLTCIFSIIEADPVSGLTQCFISELTDCFNIHC